jgi:hypothetical protein
MLADLPGDQCFQINYEYGLLNQPLQITDINLSVTPGVLHDRRIEIDDVPGSC